MAVICHVCNGKEFTEEGYECHLQTSFKHKRRLVQQQLNAKTLGPVLEEASAHTSPKSELLPATSTHSATLPVTETLVSSYISVVCSTIVLMQANL